MIPVHVISLEGSQTRRMRVLHQMNDLHIPFQFFDAIDGRSLADHDLSHASPRNGREYGGMLTPAEIGCALSHLSVIGRMAQCEKEDYFAVIEDDVLVLPALLKFLDPNFLRSLPSFDILQLSNSTKKPRFMLDLGSSDGFKFFTSPKCRFNMCAVVYTREAARLISSRITGITAPIDNMIFHDRRPFSSRVIEVRPSVVIVDQQHASDIGHRLRPKSFFAKLDRELRRFRNWARLWASFVHVWGISKALRLRPLDIHVNSDAMHKGDWQPASSAAAESGSGGK